MFPSLRHSQARFDIKSLQQVLGLPHTVLPGGHGQEISRERHPGGILIKCLNHLSWLTTSEMGLFDTSRQPVTLTLKQKKQKKQYGNGQEAPVNQASSFPGSKKNNHCSCAPLLSLFDNEGDFNPTGY